MPHCNVPVFIPHLGCPNQCVFCNQHSISGCNEFRLSEVREQIDRTLATIPLENDVEIAFFGGSFTGIDRALMIDLLNLAQEYVVKGRVGSIRLSTRPDYINDEILEILSRYAVKTIELGLQSMDDGVLLATERGHTSEQARRACRAVTRAGFSLVGQMMIGLPESDLQKELATAREIASLGASAARIYPTVVFRDTPLGQMTEQGVYRALSVEEAVRRSAEVLRIFVQRQIPCIRIGLCAGESLTSPRDVVAGPNHPALGELVWSAFYYEEIKNAIGRAGLAGRDVLLRVPKGLESKIAGQKRHNIEQIKRETDTRICKIVGDRTCAEIVVEPWCAGKKQQEDKRPCI